MDLSDFSPTKKTLLSDIVKLLNEVEDNTRTKAEETLKVKMIQSKHNFLFNKPLNIPEIWLLGLRNLQIFMTPFTM